MKIVDVLNFGKNYLHSTLDAEVLLVFVMGLSREGLYVCNAAVGDFEFDRYQMLLERRKKGEPVAYITGKKEFFGTDFVVGPETLIPRPETEFILEFLSEYYKIANFVAVADIGTGSGAIGLSIAKMFGSVDVCCSDISLEALNIARKNAAIMNLKNVFFLESDLLSGFADFCPEVMVANLPYIGTEEFNQLEENVREYEPHLALFAGRDGLDLYRRFFQQVLAGNFFARGLNILIGEFGNGQSERLYDLLNRHFSGLHLYFVEDLSGTERFFMVSRGEIFNFANYHAGKITTS